MIETASTRACEDARAGIAVIAAEPRKTRRVSMALHFGASFRYRGKVLPGAVFDNIETALFDRLGVHELAAHRYGAGSRLKELAGRFQVHAAGRDHVDVGKRTAQRFDVLRTAHISARENLDDIGAGFPSRDDFGRRERARADHLRVALYHFDGGDFQA